MPTCETHHLETLSLWRNWLTDVGPLVDLPQLQSLDLRKNQIEDVTPLAPLTSLEFLRLGENPIGDTEALLVLENLTDVDVYIVAITGTLIADPNLEKAVRTALDKRRGDLSIEDVAQLTILEAPDSQIQSLEGIEYLTSLQTLDLSQNAIEDLSPLAGLTQLHTLYLGDITQEVGEVELPEHFLAQPDTIATGDVFVTSFA